MSKNTKQQNNGFCKWREISLSLTAPAFWTLLAKSFFFFYCLSFLFYQYTHRLIKMSTSWEFRVRTKLLLNMQVVSFKESNRQSVGGEVAVTLSFWFQSIILPSFHLQLDVWTKSEPDSVDLILYEMWNCRKSQNTVI